MTDEEYDNFKPSIVIVDENNNPVSQKHFAKV